MSRKFKGIIVAAAAAMTAVVIFTGCVHVNINSSVTSSDSNTEVVTDQAGVKHEVTHTVKTENGVTTEYFEGVVFEISNDTDEDINEVRFTTEPGDWSDNILNFVETDYVLSPGEVVYGLDMSFNSSEPVMYVKIVMDDGEVEFDGYDLMQLNGATQFTISFSKDAETEGYFMNIQ